MKKLSISLMIDFLEGTTSKDQSLEIQEYITLYPYYKNILIGLQLDLVQFGSKAAVLKHLQQQKEKARKKLFSKTTPTTNVL